MMVQMMNNREIKKIKKSLKIDKIIFVKNQGKGHAIKLGQKAVKEKYTIIQDADLEYNPKDYLKILKVLEKNIKLFMVLEC